MFDRVRLVWKALGIVARARKEVMTMPTLNTNPTVGNSKTIRWALFGPAAIAILQAAKLIPGVPPAAHPWIDRACELIGLITGSGVAVGLRTAAGANAAALQQIKNGTVR